MHDVVSLRLFSIGNSNRIYKMNQIDGEFEAQFTSQSYVNMTSIWRQYDINMISIWRQYDVNMTSIWCQCGVNMMSMWCQYDVNMYQYDVNMASIWRQYDVNMMSIWRQYDVNAISISCHVNLMSMSCHVNVMSMSCPCHVHVMSCHVMSCQCHVYVMSMSCHVNVMSISCPCHVMSMSCPCHVHVMSLSCPCHVHVMSKFELCRSEAEHATSRSRRLSQYWSGEETFCIFENWMPERGTSRRPSTFQAGRFNHCNRAPVAPFVDALSILISNHCGVDTTLAVKMTLSYETLRCQEVLALTDLCTWPLTSR